MSEPTGRAIGTADTEPKITLAAAAVYKLQQGVAAAWAEAGDWRERAWAAERQLEDALERAETGVRQLREALLTLYRAHPAEVTSVLDAYNSTATAYS